MRILILGAGKMGSFFTDVLSFQHETAVFDVDPKRLRFVYNTYRYTTLEEIEEFKPELVINAATEIYAGCFSPSIARSPQGLHHQRYCLGKDRTERVL